MTEVDVIVISDFRLPGGTNKSTAQELAVHRALGLRTALLQSNSRLVAKPVAWSDQILSQLEPGVVEPIHLGKATRARLAIMRHPITLESLPSTTQSLSVERAIVVANQTAIQPNGKILYNADRINQHIIHSLGVAPLWAPIGPVVRESLERWAGTIDVLDHDWTNIFNQSTTPTPRTEFNALRPTIGRHSRPQTAKWPTSKSELEAAYPTSGNYRVKILGGAKPAKDVLGSLPRAWEVAPFGSMDPATFLADVDFWVYFHHPQWREAYGRAIMEALWSGAVAILPDYLKTTYGAAAVYAEPHQVQDVIASFQNGHRDFIAQSIRGQSFAASHMPQIHIDRLQRFLGGDQNAMDPILAETSKDVEILEPPRVELTTALSPLLDLNTAKKKPRALVLTSNGAGMGHLTRMLGLSRWLDDTFTPVFFSMSQGLAVVEAAGFAAEYVPFSSALQTKSPDWHAYFQDRLSLAIWKYRAEALIFDGTWPYRGLLETMRRQELFNVWVRRGMWKPKISAEQLAVGSAFDLIIEPGDYAAEYDTGATSKVYDAHSVAPMALLSPPEILSRQQALVELGLDPDRDDRYALVTLGAGNINDVQHVQSQFVRAIQAQQGWRAVVTQVPIASSSSTAGALQIRAYPVSRFLNAFDYAVSAAGYNSFTEWMSGSLPAIWVPNLETETDDQDARARWAAHRGLGLRVASSNPIDIWGAVGTMTDVEYRLDIRKRLEGLPPADGASQAAQAIKDAWGLDHR